MAYPQNGTYRSVAYFVVSLLTFVPATVEETSIAWRFFISMYSSTHAFQQPTDDVAADTGQQYPIRGTAAWYLVVDGTSDSDTYTKTLSCAHKPQVNY